MNISLKEVETTDGSYYAHEKAIIDSGATIGAGTVIWAYAHIFPRAVIGKGCVIGEGVGIENDARLGDFSKIQTGARLYGGLRTGPYVFIGPNATTTNDRNPRAFGGWEKAETIIEIGASIGANATLVAGNRIGALSLVAAGAVVSKEVLPGSVVMGNPARLYGWADISGRVISREKQQPPELTAVLQNPLHHIKAFIEREESHHVKNTHSR